MFLQQDRILYASFCIDPLAQVSPKPEIRRLGIRGPAHSVLRELTALLPIILAPAGAAYPYHYVLRKRPESNSISYAE
jgi:hypothetical protein